MIPTITIEVIIMTSQMHFRMDDKEKKEFGLVLKRIGLTPEEAFRVFAKKSIEVGGLPFEMSQPTPRLNKAIKSRDYVEFDNPKDGLTWLND